MCLHKTYLPYLISFLFIRTATSYCQSEIFLPYTGIVKDINFYSKSAVCIETPKSSGSGVIVLFPTSDTSHVGLVNVITAKHVLAKKYDSQLKPVEYFDTATVLMKTKNGTIDKRIYITLAIDDTTPDFQLLAPMEVHRPFSEYDAYVINADNQVAKFSEISTGQTAFIAGYPYRIGKSDLNPVIQSGIIAYVDTTNLLVLVDIPVNYGNSGCPAFCITNGGEVKLIGLVYEYEVNNEDYVINLSNRILKNANSSLGRVLIIQPILKRMSQNPLVPC